MVVRRSGWPCSLRLLDCWKSGFESLWGHGRSSLVFVVCRVGSGSCDDLITRSESPTGFVCVCVFVWVCVCLRSSYSWPRPDLYCCATDKNGSKHTAVCVLRVSTSVSQHCITISASKHAFSGCLLKYCKLRSQFPTANSSISEWTEVTSWYTYFSSDVVVWSLISPRARAIISVVDVYVNCIEKWLYTTH
jgi:hypothetical protein